MPLLNARGGRKISSIFPLSISSSGRYLETAVGDPFILIGDTPWSISTQLTDSQINTYLDARQSQGFNAILVNIIDHLFSNNSPPYRNVEGDDPFTSDGDFANPNNAYWNKIDYIVNGCYNRGIVFLACFAYYGYEGGVEGWFSDLVADSAADLQTYGAFLANRYTQGNIIWVAGGDYEPSDIQHQWNISTGIRSIRPTDLITAHGWRYGAGGSIDAYAVWNGETGFNLNNTYVRGISMYQSCPTARGRTGPIPFFHIEGSYENEASSTDLQLRQQPISAILSGGCGSFFGNNPIWGFGEPNVCGGLGPASALSTDISTTATIDVGLLRTFFETYEWWKLEPKTDTSLVTTTLDTGWNRIYPALASDGSFAMIYNPGTGTTSVTINMTAFTPSSVRARWYNPADQSYSAVAGSPFSNSSPGTQALTFPGERILVMDANP